jgi:hypothetical protein
MATDLTAWLGSGAVVNPYFDSHHAVGPGRGLRARMVAKGLAALPLG